MYPILAFTILLSYHPVSIDKYYDSDDHQTILSKGLKKKAPTSQ